MSTAIDQGRYREVLGHFASGVTVVAALTEDGPLGFTCQSFSALSLDPALVMISPAKTSSSWPRMQAVGSFCVSVLSDEQEAVALAFATSGGPKFEGLGYHPAASGSPIIDESLAFIDCEIDRVIEAGDHLVVIAKVRELGLGEGRPLLYYRSGFAGLGQ